MKAFACLALLLAIIHASCYSPTIAECQYSCGFDDKPCPEEQVCNSENKCVSDFFVRCGPGPPPPPLLDAPDDSPFPDAPVLITDATVDDEDPIEPQSEAQR